MYRINVADVTHILLDQWYDVAGTFDTNAYQFVDSSTKSQYPVSDEYTAFIFQAPDGSRVMGPISAIRAVKYREPDR